MTTNDAAPGPRETPYTTPFFERQQGESLRSAGVVVPIVMTLTRPRSVVDVGCGVGAWLSTFAKFGVSEYLGLDGDYVPRDRLLIDASHFRQTDLSKAIDIPNAYDLAVCLEVGEHLPAKSAPDLVACLTRAAPCVLFSAALPGQGGTNHVNERWPAYWQRLFSRHGYTRLDPIRPRVWRNPDVAWWYKQNTYLYCKNSEIAASPALQEEAKLAADYPFELIHEDVLGPHTTFRGAARNLLGAGRRAIGRVFGANG